MDAASPDAASAGAGAADATELAAWLRLALTPGLGASLVRVLLCAFGPPAAVLAQPLAALAAHAGPQGARALLAADAQRDAAVARALDWAALPGNRLMTLADADYPPLLLQAPDPPVLLHVVGEASALGRPSIAVVGSRNATRGGLDNARGFARALADAGLTVVSGLARGIDAAAHAGALGTPAGTVAVLGTGIDQVYPPEHAPLAERIVAEGGALVAEAPLGAQALPSRFPQRNRIIAGLACGVLVVEAAQASGSLITARLAGDAGRDVFAVPGSIHSPLSRGCHRLIQQGAKLVENAGDVLAELRGPAAAAPAPRAAGHRDHGHPRGHPSRRAQGRGQILGRAEAGAGGPGDDALLAAIGFDPVHPDALVQACGLPAGEVAARLLALELAGRIERLPDGRCLRLS